MALISNPFPVIESDLPALVSGVSPAKTDAQKVNSALDWKKDVQDLVDSPVWCTQTSHLVLFTIVPVVLQKELMDWMTLGIDCGSVVTIVTSSMYNCFFRVVDACREWFYCDGVE